MSDEYGDAAGDGEVGGPEPLDPALASRLDTMHRTLSTLGTRIDALVTSTTTYRSALTDRLNEYTELVSKLTRAQAADLEEHRRTNDRAAAELRQGLTSSEQALERVSARIEAMASGAGGDDRSQMLAELAAVRDAQDQLARAVAESSERTAATIEQVQEALLDVASGEVMGALWDEFRGTRASLDEMRIAVERSEEAARSVAEVSARPSGTDDAGDAGDRFEPLLAEVGSLTAAVRDLLEQAEVVEEPAETADLAMLNAVATDVASLRGELARGLVVEPSDALAGAVDQLRADVAGLDDRLAAITALQDAVADLRGAVGEAVAVEPAEDPGPDPALARIDERLAGVGELLGAVEQRLTGLDRRVGGIDEVNRALDELRALLEEGAAAPGPADEADPTAEELRTVRDRVTALGERLDSIAVLQEAVTSLRDEVRAGAAADPAPAVLSEELEGELATLRTGLDAVDGELRSVRSGVEDIIARLDDGLQLADEVAAPAAAPAVPDEVADRLAALRDEVSTGFDSLRSLVDAAEPTPAPAVDLGPITELLEHVRDDLAELPGRIEIPAPAPAPAPAPDSTGERFASLDPDVVDVLREEIRAAGAVPEDLLDQLRKELMALRRRIKLRAEGEVLTDEQLELIAEAVARRLAD